MAFSRKNIDLRIVLAISIVIALTFMAIDKTKEFGTNLLTEVSGVAITVFVINKILERKERQKRISIDQRILKEVQFIIASYFTIWKHLVWKYLPSEKIQNPKNLIKVYPRLLELTRINQKFDLVSIHHPESWQLFFHNRTIKECFENYYETLSEEIQSFINDYKIYLEPELLDKLLNIMECQYFRNILMMNQDGTEQVLKELGQDANKLDSYLSPEDESHLHLFIDLMDYSQGLRKTINEFTESDVELYSLDKYFVHPVAFSV